MSKYFVTNVRNDSDFDVDTPTFCLIPVEAILETKYLHERMIDVMGTSGIYAFEAWCSQSIIWCDAEDMYDYVGGVVDMVGYLEDENVDVLDVWDNMEVPNYRINSSGFRIECTIRHADFTVFSDRLDFADLGELV